MYTKSNRTLESNEVQTIIQSKENEIDLHIFVKKDDDEGSDFYYLGKASPNQSSVQKDKLQDGQPVVHMNMVMEPSIESKLYHYLVNESQN
ncbi:protein of unknown function [Bacillus sp. OV322]|nr:protein of unknown function [Bacillus sp. OV322]